MTGGVFCEAGSTTYTFAPGYARSLTPFAPESASQYWTELEAHAGSAIEEQLTSIPPGHCMTVPSSKTQAAAWRLGSMAIVTIAVFATLTALNSPAGARNADRQRPAEMIAPRDVGEPIIAVVSIKFSRLLFMMPTAGCCARRYPRE